VSTTNEHRPTVLHVLEAFAGGTERHLLDLVRYLDSVEHVIVAPAEHHGRSTSRATQAAREAGARVELIDMSRSADPHNLSAPLRVRALIHRTQPDVLHGHSSIGGAIARLAALGTKIPVVYTGHGLSRNRWAMRTERVLRGRLDRFIAVSAGERDFAIQHGITTDEQSVVIPNGIDLDPAPSSSRSLRRMLNIAPSAPMIGCIARLASQKAPDLFVAASAIVMERRPDAHFILIGYGPLQRDVEQLALEKGLGSSFHLVDGLVDAAECLSEFDVFTLPSRFEGAPYSLLEAMRAGTPVVVTNVVGNRDTVQDGVTGLIVPPEDAPALADAIVRVLDDRVLAEYLVSGARAGLPRFDVHSMVQATERVYGELCDLPLRRRRPPVGYADWRKTSA
jgi:glycosyltransferase involved in cell wall biosynthesis